MSALFARVVKQALITFERENYPGFKTNFNALKQLVDQLTSKDIGIDADLLSADYYHNQPNRAPVTYVEILEHNTFTMSVFIMANRYTMPLHDHPGYGLLRVISGTARIQSYSLDEQTIALESQSSLLPVIEESPIEVTERMESSVLTMTKNNFHEITAIGTGPTAFFDILSPPYESQISEHGPKKCQFYRKINWSRPAESSAKLCYLQRINTPLHYYCDNASYKPPGFLTDPNFFNTTDAKQFS